jgi:hypothetical protein
MRLILRTLTACATGWLARIRRQPDAELAAAPSDTDIMGQVRLLRRAAARDGHRYFP